jgi:prevent-host-death family protein
MEQVGVRELKNHLARYLRHVREGRSIIVTRRGKPIARLVPLPPAGPSPLSPDVEDKLWELTAEGLLAWSGSPFQLPESAAVNPSEDQLSDLVVEDRE